MKKNIYYRYFDSELLKMRWSILAFVVLIGPAISLWIGFGVPTQIEEDFNPWLWFFSLSAHKYTLFFYPLMIGVFAAFVCRYEHIGNGWNRLFSLPISRLQIYLTKLAVVALLALATQMCFLIGFLSVGTLQELTGPIPWGILVSKTMGGWISSFPLMALTLGCSLFWKNFAATFAFNVVFTIPSIVVTGASLIGVWYPWSQPFLAIMPEHKWSAEVDPLFLTVGVLTTFLIFIASTSWAFVKRDW
ncbi:hypothetical protein ADL26_07815 [Thermoactinomyces vulgaris]|jgi:hypothetical protein|nr:hypothetical protein ADL26_07815 [Thermoactinomyces vulgaris]